MANKGFFPIFLDLREKHVVIVGGGRIASRRVGVLAEFQTRLTLISPTVTPELRALADSGRLSWLEQPYTETVLEQADLVLLCTDDAALNHEIWLRCKALGILVNNCSNRAECDFYFPGVVSREETVVAVNAGGNAHKKAAALRKRIEKMLEEEEFDDA